MGLGNGNPSYGNKGSNFDYELKVLQGLDAIATKLETGGACGFQGTTYKYLCADGTPVENGAALIDAYNAAKTGDTIILGPGDYSLAENPITLGEKYVQISGLVEESQTQEGRIPTAQILYYADTYSTPTNAIIDFDGTTVKLNLTNWQNFNVQFKVKLLNGDFLCAGSFYSPTLGNYNIVKLNALGEVIYYTLINIGDPSYCVYFQQSGIEYLVGASYSNQINVYNANTLGLIRTHTLDSAVTGMTNNFGQSDYVYARGYFTLIDGVSSISLCKVNIVTGAIDTTFATNIGTSTPPGDINDIALNDNALVLVGGFSSFNGIPVVGYIYALNLDGTPNAAMITNFGTGFSYGPWSVKSGANMIIAFMSPYAPPATYNSLYTLDSGVVQLSPLGVFESVILTLPGYKADGQNSIIQGDTLLLKLFNNNFNDYGSYSTVVNYVCFDIPTVTEQYRYITSSSIPKTASVNVPVACINDASIHMTYTVYLGNDPAVFLINGQYPYVLRNLSFNGLCTLGNFYYGGGFAAGCSINNIYGSGIALNGYISLALTNCRVGTVTGSIRLATNCTFSDFTISKPGSYQVYATFQNCNINSFYSNIPILLSGDVVFRNCTMGTSGLLNLTQVNVTLRIENSKMQNFMVGTMDSANVILHVFNTQLNGNCFNLTCSNPGNIEVYANNVYSTPGSYASIFNLVFSNSSGLNGNINIKDSIITSGYSFNFNLNTVNGTNGCKVIVDNCQAGDNSFNSSVANSLSTNNIPSQYVNSKGGLNCFNNNRPDGGIKVTATYANCFANEQSFNCLDGSMTPIRNNMSYDNCTVQPLGTTSYPSFQVIAATQSSYIRNCMMTEDTYVFLNPTTGGGTGRVISCNTLTFAGVVTLYNY